jgi:hypothetical protein
MPAAACAAVPPQSASERPAMWRAIIPCIRPFLLRLSLRTLEGQT